jgi:hypothetical protein
MWECTGSSRRNMGSDKNMTFWLNVKCGPEALYFFFVLRLWLSISNEIPWVRRHITDQIDAPLPKEHVWTVTFLLKQDREGVIVFLSNHPVKYPTYVQFLPSCFNTSAGTPNWLWSDDQTTRKRKWENETEKETEKVTTIWLLSDWLRGTDYWQTSLTTPNWLW